jgi:outer membrane receptor for ferrienterochelin and colicins
MVNIGYSTDRNDETGSSMLYDLTIQWFSKKRLPSTSSNPDGLRTMDYSPGFPVVNSQVTRNFNENLALYIGLENIFDFRQTDLMIDPLNPHSDFFDASLIWGPVKGRMAYAGLRFKL